MRLRKTCAVLVAVFMLALSSWAGACDVSCSLGQLHSGCGSSPIDAADAIQTSAMPADMDMRPEQGIPEANSSLFTSSTKNNMAHHLDAMSLCEHAPCNQDSLSGPSSPRVERRSVQSTPAIPMVAIQPDQLDLSAPRTNILLRPPGFFAMDPLSIALRV
jgi:hypothetical protein